MKNRKRIVWLHPHFLNWMGGHKYIYEIILRLKRKYYIILVSDVFSSEARKRFKNIGVQTVVLSGISTNKASYWLFLPYFIIKDWLLVNKLYKTGDIIISSMFPMNIVAMLLGGKHIQLCYEPFAFFYDSNFIGGFSLLQRVPIYLTKFVYSWLDILATKAASVVLTLSEFNKRWIYSIYHRDAEVVYEGVDIKFFSRKFDPRIAGKYKNLKIIFHSTDFTNIKGTAHLFKAMVVVIKKIPNTRLLISSTLNNSKEKDELVKFAKRHNFFDSVEFLGFLPYGELPIYLSMADVVVQPSVGQSMNLTVKEAMSCGTPVITSLEGGEQYKDGEAGFLINPIKIKTLANKIIILFNNKRLSVKMGLNGVKIIKEKFNWKVVYDKIYSQIKLIENEKV